MYECIDDLKYVWTIYAAAVFHLQFFPLEFITHYIFHKERDNLWKDTLWGNKKQKNQKNKKNQKTKTKI